MIHDANDGFVLLRRFLERVTGNLFSRGSVERYDAFGGDS